HRNALILSLLINICVMLTSSWLQPWLTHLPFKDSRLRFRFVQIVSRLSEHPGLRFTRALPTWASLKGAYRFMGNRSVAASDLTVATAAVTQERIVSQLSIDEVVLCVQDTTELNLTRHRGFKDAGQGT